MKNDARREASLKEKMGIGGESNFTKIFLDPGTTLQSINLI